MMKKTLLSVAIATMCTTGVMAGDINIGAGIALAGNNSVLRVPLDISASLRVEPEVSFGYNSYDGGSDSSFGLGAGVYLMSAPSKNINVYYGGRVGFVVASADSDFVGGESVSNNSFYLTPTAGFEYFLDPKVSIGGEVGFALAFGDASKFGIVTATTLRYYF